MSETTKTTKTTKTPNMLSIFPGFEWMADEANEVLIDGLADGTIQWEEVMGRKARKATLRRLAEEQGRA